nr:PREDICTED: uncharacterized protein LOC105674031 [Linepithema humile]
MSKEERERDIRRQRERLIKQKEFLTDILSKIEKQILALQVERLHLRSTLFGTNTGCSNQEISNTPVRNNSMEIESVTNNPTKQLDLSLPSIQYDFEEEVDEDDESSS